VANLQTPADLRVLEVRTAAVNAGELRETREGLTLAMERPPEAWGGVLDCYVTAWWDGEEIPVDGHRRIVNPPLNVVEDDAEVAGLKRLRRDPLKAMWDVLFDSLRISPNAECWGLLGNTVTTVFSASTDDMIASNNETYATADAGSGTLSLPYEGKEQALEAVGQRFGYTINQTCLEWDTSSIGAGQEASSVVPSFVSADDNAATDFDVELREFAWGTLTTADWRTSTQLAALNLLASLNTSGWDSGAVNYNDLSAEAAILSWANLLTGTVQGVLCSSRQGTQPSVGVPEHVGLILSEATGTTQDPKLTITHAAPAPAITAVTPVNTPAGAILYPEETGAILTGTAFPDGTGSSLVEIGDNATYASADLITWPVDAWDSATQISMDAVPTAAELVAASLPAPGVSGTYYVFVTDEVGTVSAGSEITLSEAPILVDEPTETDNAGQTSIAVAMPATVTAGRALVVLLTADANPTYTTIPTDFTEGRQIGDGNSRVLSSGWWKEAEGDEGGATRTWGHTGSEDHAAQVFQFKNWESGNITFSTGAGATTTNPNPDDVTAGWGSDFNYFLAYAGWSAASNVTATPASFTDLVVTDSAGSGTARAAVGSGRQVAEDDSVVVGTFTNGTSTAWAAFTVVLGPLTGGVAVTGTMAATLQAPTASLTGAHGQTGSMASILQAATASMTGVMQPSGVIAAVLQAATASLSGAHGQSGALAAALQAALMNATGAQGQTGTLVATLQAALANLTGVMQPSGAIAAVLQAALMNATGAQGQSGTLGATLQAALANLEGVMQPEGAIAAELQPATASMTGILGIDGTMAAVLQVALFNATGVMHPSGVMESVLQALTASLTGAHGQTGAIAAELQAPAFAGAGAHAQSGELAGELQPASFAGEGELDAIRGTMAAVMTAALFNATGVMHPTGVIAAVLQSPTFAGEGGQTFSGVMAATLQMLLFVSTGDAAALVLASLLGLDVETMRARGLDVETLSRRGLDVAALQRAGLEFEALKGLGLDVEVMHGS
jgi:hypothetical protein